MWLLVGEITGAYFHLSLTRVFQLFYTKQVFVDAFQLRKETLKSL